VDVASLHGDAKQNTDLIDGSIEEVYIFHSTFG